MSDPGDEQLLAAWAAGDRIAGGALLDRYFALVCRFFANKLPDDAEDLVQQTFLACVEGRDRLRSGAFRSYLFGAAHNVLRAQLRRRLRTRADSLDDVVLADVTPSPSTIIADRREQRMLLEGLRRLPLHQQIALELYFWERMTAAEIGDALALPEGTVRTRLRDGRLKLLGVIDRLRDEPRALPTTESDVDRWADDIAAMLASWAPP
ncbi:MAG TPA: sigma-70 family RNA polymerase sigma factor [Nannocystaceae bacterium]|nr:sigma-70 family RNA polymerase sigma factor [Nannocystaceae bacterium]